MSQSYRLSVQGMHCASCEVFLEEELSSVDGLSEVKACLGDQCVTFVSQTEQDPQTLADQLTQRVKEHGYQFATQAINTPSRHREFLVAIPIAVVVLLAFVGLQRIGLVELISGDQVTYMTAFLLGLVASVSTCLAVVGGLVLSVSSNAAKAGGKVRAPLFFHVGRLGGFFLLGGLIGVLGSVFQLGYRGTAILSIAVALVMVILGLNLLEITPLAQKLHVRLPKRMGTFANRWKNSSHRFAPLLAGIATFFLPCGFTQSMQVYTLTTGSFVVGGLTMFVFALGTLPVLALLSFGAFQIAHRSWKGTFFKVVGIVVIALALYNLWNGLISLGLNGFAL